MFVFLFRGDNWSLLSVFKGFFEGVLFGEIVGDEYVEDDVMGMGGVGFGWGDVDIDIGDDECVDLFVKVGIVFDVEFDDVDNENDGWGMDELELLEELMGGVVDDIGVEMFYSDVFIVLIVGVLLL